MNTSASLPIRVAVVEDDHHQRHDLVDFLTWKGYQAAGCESAESFVALQQRAPVDLVLLDIGLPGCDGLSLARQLRDAPNPPGIVVLTAFSADQLRIQSLQDGADAYLVKGASLELIEATCKSVIRRLRPAPVLQAAPFGPRTESSASAWVLDATRARLRAPQGETVMLTHTEAVFLQSLLNCAGQAVTRQALLLAMNKPESYSSLRNLDNCATRLRRKVAQATGQELPIRACYGQGYAFGDEANVRGPE
jgi:two-component system, OmpR family, response regulator